MFSAILVAQLAAKSVFLLFKLEFTYKVLVTNKANQAGEGLLCYLIIIELNALKSYNYVPGYQVRIPPTLILITFNIKIHLTRFTNF